MRINAAGLASAARLYFGRNMMKLANLLSDNPPKLLSALTSGYVIASICCRSGFEYDSGYRILLSKYHPETDETTFLFEVKKDDIYHFVNIFDRLNTLLLGDCMATGDDLLSTNE